MGKGELERASEAMEYKIHNLKNALAEVTASREDLLGILRKVEFIEYEDSDEGPQIFCPVCGETPERKRLPKLIRDMYPEMGGIGHDKNCKLARALYGPG